MKVSSRSATVSTLVVVSAASVAYVHLRKDKNGRVAKAEKATVEAFKNQKETIEAKMAEAKVAVMKAEAKASEAKVAVEEAAKRYAAAIKELYTKLVEKTTTRKTSKGFDVDGKPIIIVLDSTVSPDTTVCSFSSEDEDESTVDEYHETVQQFDSFREEVLLKMAY